MVHDFMGSVYNLIYFIKGEVQCLNSHIHRDLWMRIIPFKYKIFGFKIVNIRHLTRDFKNGKWSRLSFQLLFECTYVITVNMSISKRMNEFSGLQQEKNKTIITFKLRHY